MLLTLGKPEIIARKIIVNYFERLGEKREDMISELTDNVNNLVVTMSSLQKRVKALEDVVFTKKDHG